MREFLLRYAGETRGLRARLIRAWSRNDIPDQVMSTSSGPKDYIKNQIWQLFQDVPAARRIIMVRGSGSPFVLVWNGAQYFDISAREVIVEEISR